MKVKLISPQLCRNPAYDQKKMREALESGGRYTQRKYVEQPAGYEIEHPDAYKLVMAGVAEAADEECQNELDRRGFGETHIWNARMAQRRVAKGIHPEDYEKFESGEIDGYTPEGGYVLGPNGEPA